MKRAIVIVMDGCGAGEAPDAVEFGDSDHPNTIKHIWDAVGGFEAPHLQACGFLEACGVPNASASEGGSQRWGRLKPLSKGGKDSVNGHWEMMGIVESEPFPTFPNGFPSELVRALEERIGSSLIGNRAASGTKIIAELGEEHVRTGKPILYTSADSVLQLACHEEVVPAERLYQFCSIARELCVGPFKVTRVIARPFLGDMRNGFVRTEKRKDFPVEPPPNLLDEIGDVLGIGVVPELFNFRGFRTTPRTQSNAQHTIALREALSSDARFIFANFEDFDMLYGHRNDVAGFAKCLVEFDQVLGKLMGRLEDEDLLILTADHGNDPTTPSTDHSREYVPAVAIAHGLTSGPVGDIEGFTAIGKTVADHLGVTWSKGSSRFGHLQSL